MDNVIMKSRLTNQQLAIVMSELEQRKKSRGAMYAIWFFLGGIGGHRYYLGDIGQGVAMTLTLGGLGFWTLIDLFMIGGRLREKTEQLESEIINKVIAMTAQN